HGRAVCRCRSAQAISGRVSAAARKVRASQNSARLCAGIFCGQRSDLQPDRADNISKKVARFFMVKRHEITSLLMMASYSTTTGLNSGGAPK
ncbi:MAG: hypothetical protein RR729_10455, partial [Comamonas sp.]